MIRNLKAKSVMVKKCGQLTILLLLISSAVTVSGQIPKRMGPGSANEIKKAFINVEANLDSLKAHQKYMYAMGYGNPALLAQYEIWMKKNPENINIPLSIGTIFHNAEMPQAKDFLLKAAAMDPKNASIWAMLAADASRWGRNDLSNEYIKKATLADPSDARYAYGYLASFENGDPEMFKKEVFEFVENFPDHELGAQALYWFSVGTTDLNDKIHYLEVLRELYPPQKFNWSASGMIRLADAYLQTDPQKALLLINDISNGGDWMERKDVAELLIEIEQLEKDQSYNNGLAKLDQIKLPGFNYISDFLALKKASLQEKNGNVQSAYDSLCFKFAKLPTDALGGALEMYGKKIGKDKDQVVKDIEVIRSSTASTAFPFELGLYTSDGKLSLDALKGKVILLTFWFPGCGPCKAEFPHFQRVVDRFKGDSLVYLGINVTPSQDDYVLPFIKNNNYSFIPLRGSASFAMQNYGVYGQPHNFVIDKDGKIIFKDFRIDSSNHRTLELMISSLLEKSTIKR